MSAATYVGDELDLFAETTRWKSYYGAMIRPFLGRRVLEVGAGIGRTATALCDGTQEQWTCLEPDAALLARVEALRASGELPPCCVPRHGTLDDLASSELFDAVLYIDVLEHIEEDGAEAARAARHLVQGGRLIVLAPAHQWLFSPFDRAVGHYRRYTRRSLDAAVPASLERVMLRYLDSVGLFASLANRLLLTQSLPTREQLHFWDKRMVPLSRFADPFLAYRMGKSVLGVFQKRRRDESGSS